MIGILVFGSTLLAAVVIAFRSRTVEWDLRLDAAGLSVRDRGAFPWGDVAEVKVTPPQAGRLHRLSLGYRVVAFIGTPGVTLPSMPPPTCRDDSSGGPHDVGSSCSEPC